MDQFVIDARPAPGNPFHLAIPVHNMDEGKSRRLRLFPSAPHGGIYHLWSFLVTARGLRGMRRFMEAVGGLADIDIPSTIVLHGDDQESPPGEKSVSPWGEVETIMFVKIIFLTSLSPLCFCSA